VNKAEVECLINPRIRKKEGVLGKTKRLSADEFVNENTPDLIARDAEL
jgi:hypothetical protein